MIMNKVEKLNVWGSCELSVTHYENIPSEVSLEYTEHQADGYYSDVETECDIEKDKAVEIVKFLMKHLDISPEDIRIQS